MTAFVIPNAILITTKTNKYTFASFLSRDNTHEVIHNSWRMSGADISGNGGGSLRTSFDSAESGRTGMDATRVNGVNGIGPVDGVSGKGAPSRAPKVTKCQCGKDGTHYTEVAMEAVFPGTPEKIHNLIFASGFMKDFMRQEQKLIGACPRPPRPLSPITFQCAGRGMGASDNDINAILIQPFSYNQICKFQIGRPRPTVGETPNCSLVTCRTSSPSTPPSDLDRRNASSATRSSIATLRTTFRP
jgi:hypothetical protein